MSKTQSVILNLNKQFSNGKASDYMQPASGRFEIGANAEVALYGASIRRKPIHLDFDKIQETLTINTNYYPSQEQINASTATATTIIKPTKLVKLSGVQKFEEATFLEFFLDKDSYTPEELAQRMTSEVNNTILNFNQDNSDTFDNQLTRADASLWTIGQFNTPVLFQIPYGYTYDRENLYLGLNGIPTDLSFKNSFVTPNRIDGRNTGTVNNSQNFPVNNTEAVSTAEVNINASQAEFSGELVKATFSITAKSNVATTDYTEFARISDSPIFPLFKANNDTRREGAYQQNESYFEFDMLVPDGQTDWVTDFFVGFTNTHAQSEWVSSSVPEVESVNSRGLSIPQVYLGARFKETTVSSVSSSTIDIYLPTLITSALNNLSGIGSNHKDIWAEGMEKIKSIKLENIGGFAEQGKFGFRFTAHTDYYRANTYRDRSLAVNTKQPNREFLSQSQPIQGNVYSFQLYYGEYATIKSIVYDSVEDSIYLPANLIEDGFLFDQIISERTGKAAEQTSLGMIPYLFINKLPLGFGIENPRGNYIMNFMKRVAGNGGPRDVYLYRGGMSFYEYDLSNRNLEDVLGVNRESAGSEYIISEDTTYETIVKTNDNTRFNPNAYPLKPNEAGLTALFPDFTKYNIEINLPVKAYTTTAIDTVDTSLTGVNDVGQKRTIVYTTEPVSDSELTLQQSLVNKNIVPNTLKFLTLDNSVPLNLNNMTVQIRRSKTNELATELEDASVELLIKSD